MKVETRVTVYNGKVSVPKGTRGFVVAVTNSHAIQESYGLKPSDGWFYLVNFTTEGKVLCDKNQLNIE